MRKKAHTYNYYKWVALLSFGLFYNTVYIARFGLNRIIDILVNKFNWAPGMITFVPASILFFYALGSFINGFLVDRYPPKKIIIVGSAVSILSNLIIASSANEVLAIILCLLNGFFQSIVWIGGIKIMSLWWKEKERGLCCGILNFCSGLSHVTAYILPVIAFLVYRDLSWKGSIILPICIMALFLIIFAVTVVERPEQVGLFPYDATSDLSVEQVSITNNRSVFDLSFVWKRIVVGRKMGYWALIALFSSVCRYGLLYWIPLYFLGNGSDHIIQDSFSNLILPLGMAFGTLLITYITGHWFQRNKGLMIVVSSALCASLIVIIPTFSHNISIIQGIFFTGFFLYGLNGILWIYAIDVGGRSYTGTICGCLNGFAYLGATLQMFFFPYVIALTGNIIIVFLIMEILCIAMIICGMIIIEKNTRTEPMEEE